VQYQFADFVVDDVVYRLSRGGLDVPLRRQALDVLLLLVSEAPRVISREELIDRVWKGNRITDNAVTQCVRDIRGALGERRRKCSVVQTVHGRGFRFTAEVTRESSRPSARTQPRGSHETAPALSVAVLPFDGLTAHGPEEAIGRRLADSISRALVRFGTIPIVPSISESTPSHDWSHEGVVARGLLVEGNVYQDGARVGASVRLADAVTGAALWAHRFEQSDDGVPATDDALPAAICSALHPELVRLLAARVEASALESFEPRLLVLRGLDHYYRRTLMDNQLAISLFSRAAEEDPTCTSAPYYLGLSHCNNVYYQWDDNWQDSLSQVRAAADRCRQCAPGHAWSHILSSLSHLFAGDSDSARVSAELAVETSPSMAEARALLGRVLAIAGLGDAAVDQVTQAMRLSPGDPWPGDFASALAIGAFAAGRYDEASRHAQRAVHFAPHHLTSHLVMAASRALSGDVAGASRVARAVRSLPRFSTAPLRRILSSSPALLADRFFTGMSLAGIPDSL
jgi:DNA-binding winged helix-turn-helix (wHTH) protein/tetratricopeptide (TPR) repeat protein